MNCIKRSIIIKQEIIEKITRKNRIKKMGKKLNNIVNINIFESALNKQSNLTEEQVVKRNKSSHNFIVNYFKNYFEKRKQEEIEELERKQRIKELSKTLDRIVNINIFESVPNNNAVLAKNYEIKKEKTVKNDQLNNNFTKDYFEKRKQQDIEEIAEKDRKRDLNSKVSKVVNSEIMNNQENNKISDKRTNIITSDNFESTSQNDLEQLKQTYLSVRKKIIDEKSKSRKSINLDNLNNIAKLLGDKIVVEIEKKYNSGKITINDIKYMAILGDSDELYKYKSILEKLNKKSNYQNKNILSILNVINSKIEKESYQKVKVS